MAVAALSWPILGQILNRYQWSGFLIGLGTGLVSLVALLAIAAVVAGLEIGGRRSVLAEPGSRETAPGVSTRNIDGS